MRDFSIAQHEMAHGTLHQCFGFGNRPPTWFDEGFAVFFESAKVSKKKVELGLPNINRLRGLKRKIGSKKVNLKEFLAKDTANKFYANENNQRLDTYAISGAFARFVYNRGKLQEMLAAVKKKPKKSQEVVEGVFGLELAEIEKEFNEFLQSEFAKLP